VVRPLAWLAVLLAVAALGLWLALESTFLRNRAALLLDREADRLLGRDVGFSGLGFDLLARSAWVEGVVVPGPAPGDPPLLTAERVAVQVAVEGLSPLRLRLTQVEVHGPRMYLERRADGTTNLPRLVRGGGGGRAQVSLERLQVTDGELVMDERRLPLDFDAQGVIGRLDEVAGGAGDAVWEGRLRARRVVLGLPHAEPLEGVLAVEGRLTPRSLELERAALAGGGYRVVARGPLSWGEGQALELSTRATADAALAARLGYLATPAEGWVELDGVLRSEQDRWSFDAAFRSASLRVLGRRFEGVEGSLAATPERLRVGVARAAHAAGTVAAELTVELAGASAAARPAVLEARVRDLSLARVAADAGLPLPSLAGRVGGELRYRFDTAAPTAGSGEGLARVVGVEAGRGGLPVSGTVPLRIAAGILEVRQARLAAPGQDARITATYGLSSRRGTLTFAVDTTAAGALSEQLSALLSGDTERFLPTAGRGTLNGEALLRPSGARARVDLDLTGVSAAGVEVGDLAGRLTVTPGRLQVTGMTARRGPGRLTADGAVGATGLDLALSAERWPAETVAPFLPTLPPAAGELSGTLALAGAAADLELRGALVAEPLTVAGWTVPRVAAALTLVDGAVSAAPFSARWPAGTVEGSVRLGLESGELAVELAVPHLDLAQDPVAALTGGRLAGTAEATLRLDGTRERPEGELSLTVRDAAIDGVLLAPGETTAVTAALDGGVLSAHGSLLGLMQFTGGGPWDLEGRGLVFDVTSDRLGSWVDLAVERPLPPVEGSFAGCLEVARDAATGNIAAALTLDRLAAAAGGRRLENLAPVVVRLAGRQVILDSLFLGNNETASELFVGGTVDLEGGGALALHLQASLGAAWAELFLTGADVEGTFDVLATVRGTTAAPVLNGQGELRQGRVILAAFPHALEEVGALVLFYPDQVVLDSFRARFAGGRVRVAGAVGLGEVPQYRLQAQGEQLSLRWPEGWLVRGGAELALSSERDGTRTLRGTLALERAFYLRDVAVSPVQLIQRVFERGPASVAAEPAEALATTQLSLAVHGPDALRVRNNLANLQGGIELTVGGTLAQPVVFGRVSLAPGGTVEYQDNRYELERGLLTFANPVRIDPVVDLQAVTRVDPYHVELTVAGTLDQLTTRFQSDPPLSDLEVLQLLTTGSPQGLADLGQASGEAGSDFAVQLLFGQAASLVSKRVTTLFGLEKFRVSPSADPGSSSSALDVALEKRLSRHVSVSYSRVGEDPERELLQVDLEVTPRLTLILTREGDGTYAVDARWEKVF
jgi:translocation and assembly module TamB